MKEIKTHRRGEEVIEYIEVTLDDIQLANRIAHDVLGRSLDELPPQTRRLLKLIDGYVREQCTAAAIKRADYRFSRRRLREVIHWGDTQLKIHLMRLVDLEYLVAYRTQGNGFDYELVYDVASTDDTLRFPGLADIDALACAYDASRSGQSASRSAPGRASVGPRSGAGRVDESAQAPHPAGVSDNSPETEASKPCVKPTAKTVSYPQPIAASSLAAAG